METSDNYNKLYDHFINNISWHLLTTDFISALIDNGRLRLIDHIQRIQSAIENATLEKKRRILTIERHSFQQKISSIEGRAVYGKLIDKVHRNHLNEDVPKMLYYKTDLWAIWEGDLKILGGPTMNSFSEHLDMDFELQLFLSRIFYEAIHYVEVVRYIDKTLLELGFQEDLLIQSSVPEKMPWNGTPAEFGAIMLELINQGYISRIDNLRTTVAALYKFFDIRNEQGSPVDDWYLYKCFGDKKRSFGRDEFRIPKSKNFKTN